MSDTDQDTSRYNVFIDLDKTLLSVDSATILAKSAYRQGLMRTRDLLNGLYLALMYKMEWRDTRKIINSMTAWMKGMPEEVFAEFASRISHDILIHYVRPEFRELIHDHQAQGARIVMLSAALSYVCQPLADLTGFDEVICSELEVAQGVFNGHPKGRLCFGEEKLVRVMAYYNTHPGDPKRDYYYADSISDLYVMKMVGFPVAVDPDKHLRRHARKAGWTIIS